MAKKNGIGDVLAATLGDVSNSDTAGREQIEYIPRTALVADEKNFYSIEGVEELAANIELIGLQQPLRVRPIEGGDGLYRVVSGHRRRAALDKLALDSNRGFEQVPCIVERDDVSPAMQELRLIYANSSTRDMTDADLAKQAERVTDLLYQLKEEGYEFPGRMRDHVAEACKINTTKLATLKVIQEKLPEQYRAEWESGKVSTDAAYKIARAPEALQARICKAFKKAPTAQVVGCLLEIHEKRRKGCLWEPTLKCPDGSACSHGDAFMRHDASCWYGEQCGGKTCCLKCERTTLSYSPCSSACAKAKQARAEQNAQKKESEEKEYAKAQKKCQREIKAIFQRLLPLIDAAGLSDKNSIPCRYSALSVKKAREYAAGEFGDERFWGSDFDYKYVQGEKIIKLAQMLHCSSDFILGLTDDPTPPGAVSKSDTGAPQWQTGEPPVGKLVIVYTMTNAGAIYRPAVWNGTAFCDPANPKKVLTGLLFQKYLEIPLPEV